MRLSILLTLTTGLILSAAATRAASDSVYFSTVEGQISPGVVRAETPLRFYLHFRVDTVAVRGFVNGFRVYSPDGATWQPPTMDTINPEVWSVFGTGFGSVGFSLDGMGADSLTLEGISGPNVGFPPGMDADVAILETRVGEEWVGHTICIDSSFLPPGKVWYWNSEDPDGKPDWGGPYCFTIASCCQGMAGNVDNDPTDEVTVSDLTYMVERGFLGGPDYECPGEADVNGDGEVSPFIPDLTYLVAYLFSGGPPPASCP